MVLVNCYPYSFFDLLVAEQSLTNSQFVYNQDKSEQPSRVALEAVHLLICEPFKPHRIVHCPPLFTTGTEMRQFT